MKKKYLDCPIEATLDAIGGKWKASILYYLADGPRRFGDLFHLLESCSSRMLARQLRELELAGLLQRNQYDEMPIRVEYMLSDYGRTLMPIIELMCVWGEVHLEKTGMRAVYN
jgi:DNA-binding HxlR family transcriptional regulator